MYTCICVYISIASLSGFNVCLSNEFSNAVHSAAVNTKAIGPGPVELLLEAVPTERSVKNPTCFIRVFGFMLVAGVSTNIYDTLYMMCIYIYT